MEPLQKEIILQSDKAYHEIKKMILDNDVRAKEHLSELQLASLIGIGRTPVREALKKLKNEGIIISSGKKGYFINTPTEKETKDLYELRAILEIAAVKLAIQRVNPDEIEEFKSRLFKLKNELDSVEKSGRNYDRVGKALHFFIIERAGNKKLEELVKKIYEQIEISRPYPYYSYGKRRKESIDEHMRLANALQVRDRKKCQAILEKHFKSAFEMSMKIL
jgi:DNA-binding GntR family transcriptional regulator